MCYKQLLSESVGEIRALNKVIANATNERSVEVEAFGHMLAIALSKMPISGFLSQKPVLVIPLFGSAVAMYPDAALELSGDEAEIATNAAVLALSDAFPNADVYGYDHGALGSVLLLIETESSLAENFAGMNGEDINFKLLGAEGQAAFLAFNFEGEIDAKAYYEFYETTLEFMDDTDEEEVFEDVDDGEVESETVLPDADVSDGDAEALEEVEDEESDYQSALEEQVDEFDPRIVLLNPAAAIRVTLA